MNNYTQSYSVCGNYFKIVTRRVFSSWQSMVYRKSKNGEFENRPFETYESRTQEQADETHERLGNLYIGQPENYLAQTVRG